MSRRGRKGPGGGEVESRSSIIMEGVMRREDGEKTHEGVGSEQA